MSSLTLDQARRAAVRSQRLDRRRRTPPVSLLRHLGAVQIDSVNVLARAHYLPFFARLDCGRADVDRLFAGARTTEYWAHEASLLTAEDRALFAWRMRGWHDHAWGNALRAAQDHPGLLEMIQAEVAAAPGTARQLETRLEADHPRDRSDWGWNWSLVKRACEALFWAGELSTRGRNAQFERIYTPGGVPDVDDAWAAEELVVRTLRACGVADRRTVRDYFRLSPAITDLGLQRALAAGRIERVQVDASPWYADAGLVVPRRPSGSALLAPFDPLVWDRRRVEQLFGFRYRIEIYTPEPQREYGYYVLPFLMEGELLARVDLKADRKAGQLLVRGAFGEQRAAAALRDELLRLAAWLDLQDVVVEARGDLAPALRAAT
jgi:uncharacterized protein YcaQ